MTEKDKFTFKYIDGYSGKEVTHSFQTNGTLDEALEQLVYFFQGLSYTWLQDIKYVKADGEEVSTMFKYNSPPKQKRQLELLVEDIFNTKE